MLVSLNWLNELVDINCSVDELVNSLSLYSIEVEKVSKVLEASNVVIGYVKTCIKHPNSDHLHITTIDIKSEVIQVVCGAPNIKEGLYVIVALEGCFLPNGLKIKKSVIRGVESFGMVCSLVELGLDKKYIDTKYQDGIYYFEDKVEVGSDPIKYLALDKEVIELGVTPNRKDLLSMKGVSYEVSAILNTKRKEIEFPKVKVTQKSNIKVEIKTPKCSIYNARLFENVVIKKSPTWLCSKLISFGIRPINNVVDITNYILALYGQPLHAFDASKINHHIVVKEAINNEVIYTLDSNKRELVEGDILITDSVNNIALGGVMGGLDSSVSETTTSIILEAALFDEIQIRKTSRRLNLVSEASLRYEKGIDATSINEALEHASSLLVSLCECSVSEVVCDGFVDTTPKKITIQNKLISNYLGIEINNVCNILDRLSFKYENKEDKVEVEIPYRRNDVVIEADLIEEIARINGYDKLELTLPKTSSIGGLTVKQHNIRKMKNILSTLGLVEAINYSLTSSNEYFLALNKDNYKDINLIYPISQERKTLRKELVSSLLSNISNCLNRKIKNANFFEIGNVYYNDLDYVESLHLGLAISSPLTTIVGENSQYDFYTLKAILDLLFKNFNINIKYQKEDLSEFNLHPTRSAYIIYNDEVIGFIGQVHPKYAFDNDLDICYVLEVNLDNLIEVDLNNKIFKQVTKVPTVERDLSFIISNDVFASDVLNTIKKCSKLIKDAYIFDLYTGSNITEGFKSIACRIVLESNETLKDEEINKVITKVINSLTNSYNINLRS